MKKILSRGAWIAGFMVISISSGCVSAGRDFLPPSATAIELGKTRSSEYSAIFGKPKKVELKDTDLGRIELAQYSFEQGNIAVVMVRSLTLEFRNDVLNGYFYVSSFEDGPGSTTVDQLRQIQRGKSSKDDVLKVLGKPQGKALCPTQLRNFVNLCRPDAEIWVWVKTGKAVTISQDSASGTQMTFVVFDKDGIVTEVTNKNR